ncbi:MAG: hypothetical protein M1835_007209, partial [Candelina submexicana]
MRNQNPTPPPKSPLHLRLLRDSTTVTITVGPTAHWTLPLPLLTTLSPFFAAAFQANHFRESQTHTISLPDDDPEIFELFVQWLFTSTFINTDPRNIWTEKAWVL